MAVIETSDLTKRYRKTLAVDQISFQVEQGQVFGFLGPNGAGKTTTIGMLLGIITPTGGGFRLFGGETPKELHAARQRIGATLEYPNFYPYLNGRDNLRIVANVKGKGEDDIAQVLEIVGLAKRKKTVFKAYSLGMKQRLALASTMLGDPELVILDEPANGLDPEGMREIRDIIKGLAERGKTIFLSSHLLWEVERTCTHVAIIQHGRIVKQASVEGIKSGKTVAGLRNGDLDELHRLVSEYPGAVSAAVRGDRVVVELEDEDLAALNRFVAERGVYLSHLAVEERTLEDVFMELTGAAEPHGMGMVD
jgi:ABC-type multidrug transport system ATPase subunit